MIIKVEWMKQILLKLTIIFLFGVKLTDVRAQEAIPASGGSALGSGGSVTYTVGQTVYTTNSDATGSVAQGVQHPYEISIESESTHAQVVGISLQCSVYPNPVVDFLTLQIQYFVDEKITCYLYDVNSKLLLTQVIDKKETLLSMTNLAPATYYLKVVQMNKDLSALVTKTFKIIKKQS
jgi:hypothetical protein